MHLIDSLLIFYIILTRIFELFLSARNTKKLLNSGAKEFYPHHYKFIIFFHIFFITYFFYKSFETNYINLYLLFVFFIFQLLRYKIIYDLGKYWTTRIIVIQEPLINTWIFKKFRHPNYLVVFIEVFLVCLIFNDIYALLFFSLINGILISLRVFYEEKANNFRRNLKKNN